MVLRPERSLKSKMLAWTSKYVNANSVFSMKRSEEDSKDLQDSPNRIVIVVKDLYLCFLIELLCQTKPFMKVERLNILSKHLHEID